MSAEACQQLLQNRDFWRKQAKKRTSLENHSAFSQETLRWQEIDLQLF
jgi:hypothetical protein